MSISRLSISRRHRRPHLQADRIADAAEVLDVRAVRVASAHADPGKVRGEVVTSPPAAARGASAPARSGRCSPSWLVKKSTQCSSPGCDAQQVLHEAQRLADAARDAPVLLRHGRIAAPSPGPNTPAGADRRSRGSPATRMKFERQRRALVAAQHQLRVRRAGGLGELRAG